MLQGGFLRAWTMSYDLDERHSRERGQMSLVGYRVSARRRIRIVHVITSLAVGGAEMMLYKILSGMDRDRFENVVCSLSTIGVIGRRIEDLGLPVHAFHMEPGRFSFQKLFRVARKLNELSPDIVQGWMYHGNFVSTLCGRFRLGRAVIWNVRQTLYSLAFEKRGSAAIILASIPLSHGPKHIIYNSHTAREQHERRGFRRDVGVVIPNGFDCDVFCPNSDAPSKLRRELGWDEASLLVGNVGRFHPQKDHATFIDAAARALRRIPNARFVMLGPDIDDGNAELVRLLNEYGITHVSRLLGERSDVAAIMAGLDLLVSSAAEIDAFPNVIGEAMSCGIPCVSTDIGDCARIMSEVGGIAGRRDPAGLTEEMCRVLEMGSEERRQLGSRSRAIIASRYSLDSVVRQYEALYERASSPRQTVAAGS